jgi:hypothetical protein
MPALEPRSFSTAPKRLAPLDAKRLAALRAAEADMAARLEDVLTERAQRVAIIARRGSDLSVRDFEHESPHYTHAALALRDGPRWSVHHLLNTDEGPAGHVYDHTLIEFFRDDPIEYSASVLVPSVRLQVRIAAVLESAKRRQAFYTPAYSCIAYPFATRYMNSNQWVIEIVAAAQGGGSTRAVAQRHLAGSGFRPSALLGIHVARQLAARLVTQNTPFDDHPVTSRRRGRFELVLESSLRRYMLATDGVRADGAVRGSWRAAGPRPGVSPEWDATRAHTSPWESRSPNRADMVTALPHSTP